MNWWAFARYFLLICLVFLGGRMASAGLVQTHHHQSASLGGQMLGHGFHHRHRTSNLWQKSLCALWGCKILQCSRKMLQFVCFLGLSPCPRAMVRVFQCYLKLIVFVKPSDILGHRPFGVWITLMEMHSMHSWWMYSLVCWQQLLDNKYGWKQENKSFFLVRFLSCLWIAWPRACPVVKWRILFLIRFILIKNKVYIFFNVAEKR